jgi:hypothetical protein
MMNHLSQALFGCIFDSEFVISMLELLSDSSPLNKTAKRFNPLQRCGTDWVLFDRKATTTIILQKALPKVT